MKNTLLALALLIGLISCSDIIGVEDISSKSVNLIAPSDNTIVDVSEVTFTWEGVVESETYHLQIATPNFENATQIVEDTLITRLNFTKSLEPKSYEWRVRGENSAYATAYTIQSFNVED